MNFVAAATAAAVVEEEEEEERARTRCREYVEALEEERRKIQVFYRELPLSLHLVDQTIEICRQQMASKFFSPGGERGGRFSGECEEETTSSEGGGGPVLEEFIPLKRSSSSSEVEERAAAENRHNNNNKQEEQEGSEKKPDWLRSVQLWNQGPDPQLPRDDDDDPPLRPIVFDAKKASGAFHPFHKEKRLPPPPAVAEMIPAPAPAAAASSTSETRGGRSGSGGGEEKEGQPHRKARRCWLPELHRRFLHALQQLGGSHAATPKQIRELMKVDGLTNDEVKSHLQKYRLHTRRPAGTTAQGNNISSPQPQQVVIVGGYWVPPPHEYAAAVVQPSGEGIAAVPPRNEIHTPVASVPTPPKQQQRKQPQRSPTGQLHSAEGRGSRDEQSLADGDVDATHSNSPATSSSSHTTTTTSTASPPY